MARKTTEEKRIDYMIEGMDFKPRDVYELTKMMLEQYRDGRLSGEKNPQMMSKEEIHEHKKKVRRGFLEIMRLPIEETREIQERFIFGVLEAPWMDEEIALILDEVEDFRSQGATYKLILKRSYFSPVHYSKEDVAVYCNIGVSQLDYRKREAIKLFGILFWKYALRTENEYLVGKMK